MITYSINIQRPDTQTVTYLYRSSTTYAASSCLHILHNIIIRTCLRSSVIIIYTAVLYLFIQQCYTAALLMQQYQHCLCSSITQQYYTYLCSSDNYNLFTQQHCLFSSIIATYLCSSVIIILLHYDAAHRAFY